jgi:nucleolar complex protein 2
MCFNLWSTAEDNVRVAAFLAIRRVASASDEAILDLVLKVRPVFSSGCSRIDWSPHPQGTYLALVRACKTTSIHTLPSINLMKNTACEVYCSDHAAAYQHAFGYVRQLAVHLRNSTKVKTKVRFSPHSEGVSAHLTLG